MSTCYANPNPVYFPAMRLVAGITQAYPAQVTTTFEHGYISLLVVRLDIPSACGMQQIDQKIGTITVNGLNTFLIDIDTRLFDPFAIPGSPNPHVNTCALVVPVGEDNSTLYGATKNILVKGGF